MSDPFVGEIRCFAFGFVPKGWAQCNGQVLPIADYTALFGVIGPIYGGNGTSNFAVPNLQGQAPMHWGGDPPNGLSPTIIGQAQGAQAVTLQTANMPAHNHTAWVATIARGGESQRVEAPLPIYSYLGGSSVPDAFYQSAASSPIVNAPFWASAISNNGADQAHENMQPYLAMNFCICFAGTFPQRG